MRVRVPYLMVCLGLALLLAHARPVAAGGALETAMTGISTSCADPDQLVTIAGGNLYPAIVQVFVGNSLAEIVSLNPGIVTPSASAGGRSLTFLVPADVPPGSTVVRLFRLKGATAFEVGSIPFQVGECSGAETRGFQLPGLPDEPASNGLFDVPPESVDESQVQDGIIMTRLDLRLAADATVGQVNAALQRVNGGIVTMLPGLSAVTIVVPRPSSLDSLLGLVDVLRQFPGINMASVGRDLKPNILPSGPAGDATNSKEIDHLVPTRFPAAWNAMALATGDCGSHRVNVLVADDFGGRRHGRFNSEFPVENLVLKGRTGGTNHGYDMITTMAAMFDQTNPTGASPFPNCLRILGISLVHLTETQELIRIAASSFPEGKFLMNFSAGFGDACPNQCGAEDIRSAVESGAIPPPILRAYLAIEWKQLTRDRWNDFLLVNAAGNSGSSAASTYYLGIMEAAFNSAMSLSALPTPELLKAVASRLLWTYPLDPSYPSLAGDVAQLYEYMESTDMTNVTADNVLTVGSTGNGLDFTQLLQSDFSNNHADVYAVGDDVLTLEGNQDGTSFTAPQVTGLAAYLWLLSPDLHDTQPAHVTRRAIQANTRPASADPATVPVIDAYASILSLDQAELPTPATAAVRLAILDVTGPQGIPDERFDALDLAEYVSKYFPDGQSPPEPEDPDYSRWDLNGDGLTGGQRTERFDLDRLGSEQYGSTLYSPDVVQVVDGVSVVFNEVGLTDAEILCYYAYSELYTGACEERKRLMEGHGCSTAGVTVAIEPQEAIIEAGRLVQFRATVTGSCNEGVTWEATGGTIDPNTGLFTAGSIPGIFGAMATSVADPTKFDIAAIEVRENCTGVTVSVSPSFTKLRPDGTVQLVASVSGIASQDVTWSLDDPLAGTITQDGLFTAATSRGTFASWSSSVRATSVACPSARAFVAIVRVCRLELHLTCHDILGFKHISVQKLDQCSTSTIEFTLGPGLGCCLGSGCSCIEMNIPLPGTYNGSCTVRDLLTSTVITKSFTFTRHPDLSQTVSGCEPFPPGVVTLQPTGSTVSALQPVAYEVGWMVPASQNWHDLLDLQLRLREADDVILALRFNETDNSFSVYDETAGDFGPSVAAGSQQNLETPAAVLHLGQTSVVASGPTSATVTLNLALSFKQSTVGRTYTLEVAATDAAGRKTDFAEAGTVTVSGFGHVQPTKTVDIADQPVGQVAPVLFAVSSFPNPVSRSATSILYTVPSNLDGSQVEISIFDITGRMIRTLVSESKGAGEHSVDWDLRDESGSSVPNGIFLFRVTVTGQQIIRKLVVMRS